MTLIGWIQIALFCAVVVALVRPLGGYMTRVFNGEKTFLSPVLRPVEAALYWAAGVDPRREQHWVTYTVAMLFFHVGGFAILYALLRLQAVLPFNPADQSAVGEDLSFNTAVSFITNTNWQNYGGESTMSYLSQMLGLTHQNFLSAATGIVLAIALIRGFARASMRTVGNFWVDITRCTLYILLPICFVYALFLVWQGIPQNARSLRGGDDSRGRQADHRRRPGRLADRNQDARHQWRRLLQRQCRPPVRKSDALCRTSCRWSRSSRSALRSPTCSAAWSATSARAGRCSPPWALLFLAGVLVTYWAEAAGTTGLNALGLTGGNMEGKEVRFGIVASVAVRGGDDGRLLRRGQCHARLPSPRSEA